MSIPTGPYVLGIDYGTESCRVGIFDLEGTPITFAATPYKTTHPRPGWAEQSPTDWWNALISSTQRCLRDSGVAPSEIKGIGMDATSATIVSLDAKGNALRPAIMWMDVRATAQAARAEKSESKARRYNGGGTIPAMAEWFPFKTAWLKENDPTWNDTYMLVDAPDWLAFRLTGRWVINENSAAVKYYYDADLGGFPEDLYADVDATASFDKMPKDVLPLGTPLGELSSAAAQDLGLMPGTPVATGCIDAYAGQIGLNVLAPGRVALITGSSHVLLGQSDKGVYGPGFSGAFTNAVIPGQYTVEAALASTGSAMKWFRDNFAPDIVHAADSLDLVAYDILNKKAEKLPIGTDGLIVNPHFQGLRTPFTDSKARAVIWGLSLSHKREHVYRALQESICYAVQHNILVMTESGYKPTELVACGGALKSRYWMQMHADVTGLPITLTEVQDAVTLGSSIMAAAGAGLYDSIQTAADKMVHTVDVIEPDMDRHEQYKFYVDAFIDTYPRIQELQWKMADHLDV
jgi:FGGY-family pentulose kinase